MINRVHSRDCLREEVARLSSGVYYNHPHEYLNKVRELLATADITFLCDPVGFYNEEGRGLIRLEKFGEEMETCFFFTWYRMPSYRWEMVGYLT